MFSRNRFALNSSHNQDRSIREFSLILYQHIEMALVHVLQLALQEIRYSIKNKHLNGFEGRSCQNNGKQLGNMWPVDTVLVTDGGNNAPI